VTENDGTDYCGSVGYTSNGRMIVNERVLIECCDTKYDRIFRKLVDGEWVVIEEQKSDMERFDEATFTGKQFRAAYDTSFGLGRCEFNLENGSSTMAKALFNMMEAR